MESTYYTETIVRGIICIVPANNIEDPYPQTILAAYEYEHQI